MSHILLYAGERFVNTKLLTKCIFPAEPNLVRTVGERRGNVYLHALISASEKFDR